MPQNGRRGWSALASSPLHIRWPPKGCAPTSALLASTSRPIAKSKAHAAQRNAPGPPTTLRQEFDDFLPLPQFAPFLSVIAEIAPASLARFASELRTRSGSYWQQALLRVWEDDASAQTNSEPFEAMLSWLFLRPYAEYLADHTDSKPPIGAPSTCPVCSSEPQVGALRPEGDGAKREVGTRILSLRASFQGTAT